MDAGLRSTTLLTLTLLLKTAVACTAVTVHEYVEDFRTTQYRDPALTTAWWDTLAGEIKLFPVEISLQGSWDSPGSAYNVVIADTFAFLADDVSGFQVVSIRDPSSPLLVQNLATPGGARGLALQDDYAYVAVGSAGLLVIDLQDPRDPQIAGSIDLPGFAHDVAAAGPYAYVAQSGEGMQIVNIDDPTQPFLLGATPTADWAQDVTIVGNYAYVADGLGGLQVIAVADPSAPVVLGTFAPVDYTFGVFVSGVTAYLADGNAGLHIIDVSDPTAPRLLGSVDTPGSARDIRVDEDFAYLADGTAGFRLVDCSDPTAPVLLGGLTTGGNAIGIAHAGELAYQASGSAGLKILAVDPAGFDTIHNRVRSLVIDESFDPITRARLAAIHTDSILWELSADGGTTWEEVIAGDEWHTFQTTGQTLLWRSTHVPLGGGINPSCSHLEIEWRKLYSHAVIDSIRDVPHDQGGQVRLHFTASRFDTLGSPTPITEYAIFRRIETARLTDRRYPLEMTGFARAGDHGSPATYPPGDWDFVLTVPADAEDRYAAVVPTLADSTSWGGVQYTTFFVRARTATPGIYFDSPPDSGYSMNNLLPTVPTGFSVRYGGQGNQLAWDPCPDPDFATFRVYRSTEPIFPPGPDNLVLTTTATSWLDTEAPFWPRHYLLTAVDAAGNESPAALPETSTGVGATPAVTNTILHQNVPNPFNPATTIHFDLARGGPVTLRIFDLRGRRLHTLLAADLPAGHHAVTWQGQDGDGHRVPAGVYTYRLEGPGFRQTLKMILLP